MTGAVIHLVAGSTGAGKTTYAMALAARERALRLSIDEWMASLFAPDQAGPPQFAWMSERVDRCESQMWAVALQATTLGTSIVVDCGLTRQAHRAKWAGLALAAGLPVRLHHLDIDARERWRRVQPSASKVTREMLDFVETLWESPSDDELARLDGVRVEAT